MNQELEEEKEKLETFTREIQEEYDRIKEWVAQLHACCVSYLKLISWVRTFFFSFPFLVNEKTSVSVDINPSEAGAFFLTQQNLTSSDSLVWSQELVEGASCAQVS